MILIDSKISMACISDSLLPLGKSYLALINDPNFRKSYWILMGRLLWFSSPKKLTRLQHVWYHHFYSGSISPKYSNTIGIVLWYYVHSISARNTEHTEQLLFWELKYVMRKLILRRSRFLYFVIWKDRFILFLF